MTNKKPASRQVSVFREYRLDALGHLVGLALGDDGWRDDHLRLVELLDVGGAAEAHDRLERADEVLRPVGDGSGAEQVYLCL